MRRPERGKAYSAAASGAAAAGSCSRALTWPLCGAAWHRFLTNDASSISIKKKKGHGNY